MGIFDGVRKLFGRGCTYCGSDALESVSLRELDSSKPFDGSILYCAGCSRLFWDSGFVLEDQRTIVNLESIVTSGSRHSIPNGAVIITEPAPPRTNLYRCILGPAFHCQQGVDFVMSVIWHPVLTENTAKLGCIAERVSIEIDGYSEDERELWQIPEVSDLFYKMHEEILGIEFWMTQESIGRFLWAAAAGMPNDLKSRAIEMSLAVRETLREHGRRVAEVPDDQLVVQYLAIQSLEKAKGFLRSRFDKQDEVINRIVEQSELAKLVE